MLDVVKTYWPILATVVSIISLVIQTLLVKTYAKREDVQSLREDGIELKGRVTAVEQTLSLMPSDGDLTKLKLEISELRGDLRGIKPELNQIRHIGNLLLENELKEKS